MRGHSVDLKKKTTCRLRRQVEWSKENVDFSSPRTIVGHTAGPWRVQITSADKSAAVIYGEGGRYVGTVGWTRGTLDERKLADAYLIACAPELLAEAKKTLRLLERVSPGLPTITELRALIARAEGRLIETEVRP